MDRRKTLRLLGSAALACQLPLSALARTPAETGKAAAKKGVMLMNRIAPSPARTAPASRR
jgi:hypothetical protein